MAKREFPKMMLGSVKLAGYGDKPEGIKREKFHEIVWNLTEYNSFITHYGIKFHISERKPRWRELTGKNFFAKVYYLFPIQIAYSIGAVIGAIVTNIPSILKYGKELYNLITHK